ncbi:hypothetical protein [Coxiella burnetii]|uniref:hypothetical protein n=1 Tax=Coxiella burnetii TaxID=777 RepID=UPI00222F5B67|nr:hypothetical protein [Coxiella burnetii]
MSKKGWNHVRNGVGDLPILADLTAAINIVFYAISALDSIDIALRLFLSMGAAAYIIHKVIGLKMQFLFC